jgi:hypothetical protein
MKMFIAAAALTAMTSIAGATEIDTVACDNPVDAQTVFDAAIATPSLQAGADSTLIEQALAGTSCKQAHFVGSEADKVMAAANVVHPEGGASFGIVTIAGKHILAFDANFMQF